MNIFIRELSNKEKAFFKIPTHTKDGVPINTATIEADGEMVGMICLNFWKPQDKNILYIRGLNIIEEKQRRGYGTFIIKDLIKYHSEESMVDHIRLQASHNSNKFWSKLGFIETEEMNEGDYIMIHPLNNSL